MKSLKDFKLSVQVGAGSRRVTYRAAPAGADGHTFDPSLIMKIDADRTTTFKIKSIIYILINQTEKSPGNLNLS